MGRPGDGPPYTMSVVIEISLVSVVEEDQVLVLSKAFAMPDGYQRTEQEVSRDAPSCLPALGSALL